MVLAAGMLLAACGPSRQAAGPSAKPSASTSRFPAAIYPSPRGQCPNLERAGAVDTLSASDQSSLLNDLNVLADPTDRLALLAVGDQMAWPLLRDNWPKAPSAQYRITDIAIEKGSADTYTPVVQHACGDEAVSKSWVAVFCATGGPFGSCQPAMTEHAFFLNRDGHWLIWQFWP
jgi:hypothetical protein